MGRACFWTGLENSRTGCLRFELGALKSAPPPVQRHVRTDDEARGDVILSPGLMIDVEDLPENLRGRKRALPTDDSCLPLAELERRHILRVLDSTSGNWIRFPLIVSSS